MVHARGSLDVTGDRHDLDSRSLLRFRDTALFRASCERLRVDCSGIPVKHRDSQAARRHRLSYCDCGMIHIVSRNRAPSAADRTTTVALWDSGFSPHSSSKVLDPVPRLTFLAFTQSLRCLSPKNPGGFRVLHALTLPLESMAYRNGLQPPKISRLDGQLRSPSVSVAFGVQVTMEGVRKRKIGCHPDR